MFQQQTTYHFNNKKRLVNSGRNFSTMTKLQRIKIVLEYYANKGANKENVNNIYRKILKDEIPNKVECN